MSAIASDGRPVVAYSMTDGHGRILAARHADLPLSAASTIKLAVLLAVLEQVDAGVLDLDSRVPARSEHRSTAPGKPLFRPDPDDADPEFPADGVPTSLRDLAAMMIERSSNEATNVLVGVVGADRVDQACRGCGAVSTRLGRLLGDVAAVTAGLDNVTCAADLARLMRALTCEGDLTASSRAFAQECLSRQRFPRIGLEVPVGTWWGSKSGDVPGVEHDVAVVGRPGSDATTRILAVCTAGMPQESAREAIRGVSSALLLCFPSL